MNLVSGSTPIMGLASSLAAIGLGGCSQPPLEMRCAAFFHQLSEVDVDDGLPSTAAANRQRALAFIDRLPGNRSDNIAAMRKVGSSIMADDGLSDECERIIPLPRQGPANA